MSETNTETKANVVVRAGIWYTVSSFLSKGIAFVTTPIFTRLLTQSEFGDYSNYVAWAGIVTIVATMDMHATVNRARYDYDNLDGYLSSVALTGTAFTTLLWIIVQMFPAFFCGLFAMDMTYINIMFIATMVTPALDLIQAKHRIRYKYKSYVALSFGSALLSTVISLIMVLMAQDKLWARILGQYGTVFVIDICVYIYILYKGRQFKWEQCKYALLICLPMIPHLLSKYILNQSDRIMIQQFCGSTDTALYSLAYNCAMIPIILGTATNIAWSPWSTEMIHAEKYGKIRKASYYYIMLFYVIIIGMFILAPEFIYLLGGEKYAPALYVMPPVVMGAAFQFLYNLYVALEQFAKKTVGMAIGTVIAALINIGLNWLLIPKYGYIAAAYTTLIGYACLLVIHYFLARRTGYGAAYDGKFIFVSVAVMFGIMMLSMFLYPQHPIIRYAIAAALIFILIKFARKHKGFIKKVLKR